MLGHGGIRAGGAGDEVSGRPLVAGRKRSARRGLTGYLVILAVILVPTAGAYYFHVQQQTRYAENRAFRALNEAATHFENNLDVLSRFPKSIAQLSRRNLALEKLAKLIEDRERAAFSSKILPSEKIRGLEGGYSGVVQKLKTDRALFDDKRNLLRQEEAALEQLKLEVVSAQKTLTVADTDLQKARDAHEAKLKDANLAAFEALQTAKMELAELESNFDNQNAVSARLATLTDENKKLKASLGDVNQELDKTAEIRRSLRSELLKSIDDLAAEWQGGDEAECTTPEGTNATAFQLNLAACLRDLSTQLKPIFYKDPNAKSPVPLELFPDKLLLLTAAKTIAEISNRLTQPELENVPNLEEQRELSAELLDFLGGALVFSDDIAMLFEDGEKKEKEQLERQIEIKGKEIKSLSTTDATVITTEQIAEAMKKVEEKEAEYKGTDRGVAQSGFEQVLADAERTAAGADANYSDAWSSQQERQRRVEGLNNQIEVLSKSTESTKRQISKLENVLNREKLKAQKSAACTALQDRRSKYLLGPAVFSIARNPLFRNIKANIEQTARGVKALTADTECRSELDIRDTDLYLSGDGKVSTNSAYTLGDRDSSAYTPGDPDSADGFFGLSLPIHDLLSDWKDIGEFDALFLGTDDGHVVHAVEINSAMAGADDREGINPFYPARQKTAVSTLSIQSLDQILRLAAIKNNSPKKRWLDDDGDDDDKSFKTSSDILEVGQSSFVEVMIGHDNYVAFIQPVKINLIAKKSRDPPEESGDGGGRVSCSNELTGRTTMSGARENSPNYYIGVVVDGDGTEPCKPEAVGRTNSPGADQSSPVYYFVGVVEQSRFNRVALAVPAGSIIWGIALLAVVVSLFPLLRIIFGGGFFALDKWSIFGLMLGSIWGVGVLTITAGHFATNPRTYDGLHTLGGKLAGDIANDLKLELEGQLSRMKKFGALVRQEQRDLTFGKWKFRREGESPYYLPVFDQGVGDAGEPMTLANFDVYAKLDEYGDLCGRGIIFRYLKGFPALRLGQREYFNWANKGALLKGLDNGGPGYALQRVANLSDGFYTTILAQPISESAKLNCLLPRVQIIGFDSAAMNQPALPRGFSFAIVDDITGEVIAHSRKRQAFVENFLSETDNNSSIALALAGRHPITAGLSGKYRGRKANFFSQPVVGTSWTAVVILDIEEIDTERLAEFLVVLGLFTTLIVFFFLMHLLAAVAWRRNGMIWLLSTPTNDGSGSRGGAADASAPDTSKTQKLWRAIWRPVTQLEKRHGALLPIGLLAGLAVAALWVEDIGLLLLTITVVPLVVFFLYRSSGQPHQVSVYGHRAKPYNNPWAWLALANGAGVLVYFLPSLANWETSLMPLAILIWFVLVAVGIFTILRVENASNLNAPAPKHALPVMGGRPPANRTEFRQLEWQLIILVLLFSVVPAASAYVAAGSAFDRLWERSARVHAARAVDKSYGHLRELGVRIRGDWDDGDVNASKRWADQLTRRTDVDPKSVADAEADADANGTKEGDYVVGQYVYNGEDGNRIYIKSSDSDIEPSDKICTADEQKSTGLNFWLRNATLRAGLSGRLWLDGQPQKDLEPGGWVHCKSPALQYRPYNFQGKDFAVDSVEPVRRPLREVSIQLFVVLLATVLVVFLGVSVIARRTLGSTLVPLKRLEPVESYRGISKVLDGTSDGHNILISPSNDDLSTLRAAVADGQDSIKWFQITDDMFSVFVNGPSDRDDDKSEHAGVKPDKAVVTTCVLSGLDRIVDDKEARMCALQNLEALCSDFGGKIIILADQQMLFRIVRPDAYREGIAEPDWPGNIERKRWAQLFARFRKTYGYTPRDQNRYDLPWNCKNVRDIVLEREQRLVSGNDLVYDAVKDSLGLNQSNAGRSAEMPLTIEEIVERVSYHAGAHYRMLWAQCTLEEKIMLFNLALGRSVNTDNVDVLNHLRRRGLVVREPQPQIACISFAQFVLTAERPEVFALWQEELSHDLWSVIRMPLILIVLVFGFMLYQNAQLQLDAAFAMFASALAFIPVLVRGLSLTRTLGGLGSRSNGD